VKLLPTDHRWQEEIDTGIGPTGDTAARITCMPTEQSDGWNQTLYYGRPIALGMYPSTLGLPK